MLGKTGAIKSNIEENPRPKIKDVLFSQLNSDSNDWWYYTMCFIFICFLQKKLISFIRCFLFTKINILFKNTGFDKLLSIIFFVCDVFDLICTFLFLLSHYNLDYLFRRIYSQWYPYQLKTFRFKACYSDLPIINGLEKIRSLIIIQLSRCHIE